MRGRTCLLAGVVFAGASAAGAERLPDPFGSNEDYGGNLRYIQTYHLAEKIPFDDAGREGSHAKGFEVIVASLAPHGRADEKFTIICEGSPTVIPWNPPPVGPPVFELDLQNLPPRLSGDSYYYDLWFTTCTGRTDLY